MSMITTIVAAMTKAGCSAQQILDVVTAHEKTMDERKADRREKNRIYQQNHRARKQSQRLQSNVSADTPFLLEGSPAPLPKTSISPSPSSLRSSGDALAHEKTFNNPSPKQELASVLDDQHVAAVIDHRQRIRKPLTAHAAHLLAGKFAKCPDPNAAADTMIANGWQGFEVAWMEDRARGTGPPGFRTSDGILAALKRNLEHDDDDESSEQSRNHENANHPLLGFAAKGHDRE